MKAWSKHPLWWGLGLWLSSWLIYRLFMIPGVYAASFGKWMGNYQHTEQGIISENAHAWPDFRVNANWKHWDAIHYGNIAEKGYPDPRGGEWDGTYAFFPLFPAIWHLTHLNGWALSWLHMLIWLASLALLFAFLIPKEQWTEPKYRLLFLLPTTFVFWMPYSEVWFLLFGCLGFCGLLKEKPMLAWLGFMLMATTRPAISIAGLALVVAVFPALFNRDAKRHAISLIRDALFPMMLGTLVVAAFQYSQSGAWFLFVKVQAYWNHVLQLPKHLVDWSEEGFGLSVWWLVAGGLAAGLGWLKHIKPKQDASGYMLVLQWCRVYFIGIMAFIVLFQGGSLNGLFRYSMATPFFYVWIIYHLTHGTRAGAWRIFWATIPLGLFVFRISDYGRFANHRWNYPGFWLLQAALGTWVFATGLNRLFAGVFWLILFLTAALWQAYLMNMFLADAWITV